MTTNVKPRIETDETATGIAIEKIIQQEAVEETNAETLIDLEMIVTADETTETVKMKEIEVTTGTEKEKGIENANPETQLVNLSRPESASEITSRETHTIRDPHSHAHPKHTATDLEEGQEVDTVDTETEVATAFQEAEEATEDVEAIEDIRSINNISIEISIRTTSMIEDSMNGRLTIRRGAP